ncbi:MAG: alpha/beta fold hydrolase [Solirubrobacterales bacterium]|nr:alpha/beta fold hydrolase [Solirubrobacterales bacterium]
MLLPVEGHHLHMVDLGQGTPLVLHSGWVASWGLWLPLVERLQTRWRCVGYDHRGTGASTFPPEAIRAEALVDDLFRVLDALAIEQAVIAGESLGCMVCLGAVLSDPSRFLGLITVGGGPRVPEQRGEAAVADPVDWPIRIAKFVDACLPEPDAAPMHRFAEGTLLPSGPEAAARMSAALAGTAPELEAVAVPTLVIHGDPWSARRRGAGRRRTRTGRHDPRRTARRDRRRRSCTTLDTTGRSRVRDQLMVDADSTRRALARAFARER